MKQRKHFGICLLVCGHHRDNKRTARNFHRLPVNTPATSASHGNARHHNGAEMLSSYSGADNEQRDDREPNQNPDSQTQAEIAQSSRPRNPQEGDEKGANPRQQS
jgi:catalase